MFQVVFVSGQCCAVTLGLAALSGLACYLGSVRACQEAYIHKPDCIHGDSLVIVNKGRPDTTEILIKTLKTTPLTGSSCRSVSCTSEMSVCLFLNVYVILLLKQSFTITNSQHTSCHLTTVEGRVLVQAEKESRPPTEDEMVGSWFSNPAGPQGPSGDLGASGVGKYLASALPKVNALEGSGGAPPAKKVKVASSYGNFDAW